MISIMRRIVYLMVLFLVSLQSCSSFGQLDKTIRMNGIHKEALSYWVEFQVLEYFDIHYCFPSSYNEVRDTCLYFYPYYTKEDGFLLENEDFLQFVSEKDSILIVVIADDTLAKVKAPCNCDDLIDQDFPSGPRAFDAKSNYMDLGTVSNGEKLWDRLWYEILSVELPAVKNGMELLGYKQLNYSERKEPRFLLCQYFYDTDSLCVVGACKKNEKLLDELYCKRLKQTLGKYCKTNGISVLLTPVRILVPSIKKDVDSIDIE